MRKPLTLFVYIALMISWAIVDAHRNNLGLDKFFGMGLGNDIASWIVKYGLAFLLILYGWYRAKVPHKWEVLGVFLIFAGAAWISVDITYGIVRVGVAWSHVGTTAITDRIFQALPWSPFAWQTLAKSIVLGGGIWIATTDRTRGARIIKLHSN